MLTSSSKYDILNSLRGERIFMSKTMATVGYEELNRSSLNYPKVAIFIGGKYGKI